MRPIHFKVIKDNQGNKSRFKRRFLRFHSLYVASVGGEKSNPCPVNCKCWVIGIFKTGSKEKITWPNLLFPVNEELRLPFTILEGSSEVSAHHSWCLTAVSVYLRRNAQVHDRGSFITVTSIYLSHCHMVKEIQAMELSASVPLSAQLYQKGFPKRIHVLLSCQHIVTLQQESALLPVISPSWGEDEIFLGLKSMQSASGVSIRQNTVQRNETTEKKIFECIIVHFRKIKTQHLESLSLTGNEEMPFPCTKQ